MSNPEFGAYSTNFKEIKTVLQNRKKKIEIMKINRNSKL